MLLSLPLRVGIKMGVTLKNIVPTVQHYQLFNKDE